MYSTAITCRSLSTRDATIVHISRPHVESLATTRSGRTCYHSAPKECIDSSTQKLRIFRNFFRMNDAVAHAMPTISPQRAFHPGCTPMAMHRFSRLWPLILLMFTATTLGTGCKGCQKNDESATESQAADPWQSTLDLLADHVPADATNAIFVVEFTTALASYPGFRARVSTYVKDYATIEADLRNTLGVDPAHPSNLAQLGIEPTGGAVCAKLQGQPVCGVTLSDHAKFQEHATSVLQGQPFNLRAPIVQTNLPSGGTLLRFASEENSPTKAAIVLTDKLGYVILRPHADTIESLAATLETPHATPLRTRPAFQKLLEHTERSAILGWLGPDAIPLLAHRIEPPRTTPRRTRPAFHQLLKHTERSATIGWLGPDASNVLGGQLFDTDMSRFLPTKNVSQGAALGIKLYADAIQGWFSVLIDEKNDKIHTLLARPAGNQAADFSKLIDDESYAFLRVHVDADEVRQTLRDTFKSEDIEDTEKRIEDALGTDQLEQELMNALGSDMIVMATRARLLTLAGLARGGEVNARALGDGLGMILVYQLKDAKAMRSLLNTISTDRADVLSHTQNEEEEFWQIEKGPASGTLLLLTDDAIIATTARQKKDVLARVAADEIPELKEIDAEEARELREAVDALGLFVDLKRVANNSLGRIASNNLSDTMRNAIQVFDEFWARGELVEDQWFDGRYRIQLSTPNRR